MSSEPAITVRNLSKVYRLGLSGRTDSLRNILGRRIRHPIRGRAQQRELFHALEDVSFDVAPGEAVGIIGRNGAGKSTLLKILSRITPPTSGHAEILGNVGCLLEVGTGFHPELTGIENVYLNGTILGMSRPAINRRLDEIVAFAEVDKFLATPVKRYSSGMRVRLAFAVAAHLEPEILIIDEVLSVGDAGFQSKCLNKMRALASEDGRTVLYVSHNLVSVEYLCPRTLLFTDGQVAFDGPTGETVAKYLSTFPHAERDTEGVFDLAAADRSGTSYDKVFRRLELRPGGGPPSEIIRMGDSLLIDIDVEGLETVPGSLLNVAVGSETTPCLFRMTTRMKPLESAAERTLHETITLNIPRLPLTPGEYHIDLQLKGSDTRGMVDLVNRAAQFSVVTADVLGTGFTYSSYDGVFVVPWDWEIRPSLAHV
jgi:lipopolysaccharide transport system ATP-binding protein